MPFLSDYDAIPDSDPRARIGFVYRTLRADWRGMFAELRAERPVFANPAFVMVTRHADVVDVMAQHELFSVRGYQPKMDPSVGPFMLARDATELNWHEKAVMRSVLRFEDLPRVRALAGATARAALDTTDAAIDLVAAVGRRVPLKVVQQYFGFRAPDEDLLRWSKATQTDMFRNPFNDAAQHQANVEAGQEMKAFLKTAILRAGRAPAGDDAFSRLVRMLGSPDAPLSDTQVVSNVAGLLVGAIETSSQAIVQAAEQILRRPDVRETAEALARSGDTAAFDALVWEALRFNPITGMIFRVAERDTVLAAGAPHATPIRKGTVVAACIGSAMFDPDVVDAPDDFRPGRPDDRQFHLGFGHHECLGRYVGLEIVPEAVRQVLLTPGLALLPGAEGQIDFAGGVFPEHFRVAKTPAAAAAAPAADPSTEPSYGADGLPTVPEPGQAQSQRGRRDTSRDGFKNKLEFAVLTSFPALWRAVGASPLGGPVNRFLIDNAVKKQPPRPGAFSTLAPYTSWESLSDRTWSARHLPWAAAADDLPELDRVAALFRRPDGGQELSRKSTYLFPAFAQWFTDGFLRTKDRERRKNTSNHEIELNPLYGLNPHQARALRQLSEKRGERGRLLTEEANGEAWAPRLFEDDGFTVRAGFEALNLPLRLDPSWPVEKRRTLFAFGGDRCNVSAHTAMMNTLFLREHNRIAGELEQRNPEWDDERVFQTARNIVTILLIKIVVEEYINHISPYPFRFRADPRAAYKAVWNRTTWIAAEFNLLYRWHSLVPDALEWGGSWVPTKAFSLDNSALLDAGLRTSMERTGANAAAHLAPMNTAEFLLDTELAAVGQGRECRLAPYNDYREAFRYPRVTRFEQISSDPRVVKVLADLYTTPDRVEYFTGIFAEDTRENAAVPGMIGRMVAADAFSHALTNPLLAERVFNADTFTKYGLDVIAETSTVAQVLTRVTGGAGPSVRMTRADWRRE